MDYMTLFPSAGRNMPRFSALAEAVLSQAEELINVIGEIPGAYSVIYAEGAQLDAFGASVGVEYLTASVALLQEHERGREVQRGHERGTVDMRNGVRLAQALRLSTSESTRSTDRILGNAFMVIGSFLRI